MRANRENCVDNSEDVVRILSNGWVKNGVVQHTAFTLREGETYISVNRPSISSFVSDVASFVESHKNFLIPDDSNSYMRAVLHVEDIRNIAILFNGKPLSIDVEVEPRDMHTKSHAGIFTRHENKNLRPGISSFIAEEKNISVDMIFLKVRLALIRLSKVEKGYL